MKTIMEIASQNGGFVTASAAEACGIQNRELGAAVDRGELVKVVRGLYCTPETWEDEYVAAQYRFARGVFSHDTALYLLGLSDSAPESLPMSFPRGYNPTNARSAGIVAKSSPNGLQELGCLEVVPLYGNVVRSYNAERTLCDMMRGTASPDLQLLSPAFRKYLASSERNLVKLRSYAEQLGVVPKVRVYLEVLL